MNVTLEQVQAYLNLVVRRENLKAALNNAMKEPVSGASDKPSVRAEKIKHLLIALQHTMHQVDDIKAQIK